MITPTPIIKGIRGKPNCPARVPQMKAEPQQKIIKSKGFRFIFSPPCTYPILTFAQESDTELY